MPDHLPDCAWEQTAPDECVYRDTHHYCPHSEHACTCPPKPTVTDELALALRLLDAFVQTTRLFDPPGPSPLGPSRHPGGVMGDTEKIARIVRRCAGGVSIEFNQHRSSYWSPSEEIDRCDYDVPLALRGEMDATDTMVVVQAYPDTPNSFYVVAHTNLTAALDEMLTTLGELIRVDESNIDYDPNDWLQP